MLRLKTWVNDTNDLSQRTFVRVHYTEGNPMDAFDGGSKSGWSDKSTHGAPKLFVLTTKPLLYSLVHRSPLQSENSNAALLFYWEPLEKQIRIEGTAERIPEAASDSYFTSRPHASQIGASVSNQSKPISNRQVVIIRQIIIVWPFYDILAVMVNPSYQVFVDGSVTLPHIYSDT